MSDPATPQPPLYGLSTTLHAALLKFASDWSHAQYANTQNGIERARDVALREIAKDVRDEVNARVARAVQRAEDLRAAAEEAEERAARVKLDLLHAQPQAQVVMSDGELIARVQIGTDDMNSFPCWYVAGTNRAEFNDAASAWHQRNCDLVRFELDRREAARREGAR